MRGESGYWEEKDLPATFFLEPGTVVAYEGANFFAEVPSVMNKMPSLEGVTHAVVIWRSRSARLQHLSQAAIDLCQEGTGWRQPVYAGRRWN
ncbi:MAG: hypothetical protein R2844_13820 [Caldilineales bacterium]